MLFFMKQQVSQSSRERKKLKLFKNTMLIMNSSPKARERTGELPMQKFKLRIFSLNLEAQIPIESWSRRKELSSVTLKCTTLMQIYHETQSNWKLEARRSKSQLTFVKAWRTLTRFSLRTKTSICHRWFFSVCLLGMLFANGKKDFETWHCLIPSI